MGRGKYKLPLHLLDLARCKCGYSLAGLREAKCPECGRVPDGTNPVLQVARRTGAYAAALKTARLRPRPEPVRVANVGEGCWRWTDDVPGLPLTHYLLNAADNSLVASRRVLFFRTRDRYSLESSALLVFPVEAVDDRPVPAVCVFLCARLRLVLAVVDNPYELHQFVTGLPAAMKQNVISAVPLVESHTL